MEAWEEPTKRELREQVSDEEETRCALFGHQKSGHPRKSVRPCETM